MRLASILPIGFLVVLLTTLTFPVWGSMGGVTNVGGFSSSAEHFTGAREWVELEGRGGMLKGSPPHDLLKFITVVAPGIKSGHIIFRELKTLDGRRSFLLTAPDDLQDKIQRMTLFLQADSGALELYQDIEGVWSQRLPQSLRVADPKGGVPQDLLAFSIKKPGFFWVLESPSSSLRTASFVPQDPSAKSLMGGSVLWGFSALTAAILLLSIGWFISRQLHTFDQFVVRK